MDWEVISYIVRSEYRLKVLYVLRENPLTPSMIASEIELALSHVSRTLSELESKGLAECLVDSARGRFYDLTQKGRKYLSMIKEKGYLPPN